MRPLRNLPDFQKISAESLQNLKLIKDKWTEIDDDKNT